MSRHKLFGTDGVRGVVGYELTPEMAMRLGRAIGAFFGKGSRMLVGRDVRAGGDMIASSLIAGLLAEGVKVHYAGLIPTPALQFSVRTLGYDGGVMVTASHNPPQYNGVKVVAPDGIELDREAEAIVEEYYYSGVASKLEWRELTEPAETRVGLIERYVEAIAEHIDSTDIAKAGFRVVVDCANSVGSLTTPLLLRRLGVKALTLNCNLDPTFPGREPEPTPDSLREASILTREAGAVIGVGHDGDADRAIFIDENGRVVWGDRSGAILARYASERWRDFPKVVFTGVSSSLLVEEYLSKYGVQVKWTPVGSIVIARSLKREGGIAGFEENGGYIHTPFQNVRDGTMTVALMLELLAREKTRLSRLVEELPQYYPVKTKIPARGGMRECAVRAIRERYKGYKLIEIDGVKVVLDKGWALVRPSGTEPVVRVMVEGRTPSDAERIMSEILGVIKEECSGEES